MENERTKELAYLFDSDEQDVETLMEAAKEPVAVADEDDVIAPEEKKVLTKEERTAEKQKQKKRKKENFPTKTRMNLFYKVDKTTGPTTILLIVAIALVVVLFVFKFGVVDILQDVSSLEQQVESMDAEVQNMMAASGNLKKVRGEYNRYTRGYLQEGENPVDRLVLLDMLEETVFADSNLDNISIVADCIFVEYTGLNLDETSALVKELEGYKWVKEVTVQSASLVIDQSSGKEVVSTSMIIETYADMEEVPADE